MAQACPVYVQRLIKPGVDTPDLMFIRHSFHSFMEFNKCLLEYRCLFEITSYECMYICAGVYIATEVRERKDLSLKKCASSVCCVQDL